MADPPYLEHGHPVILNRTAGERPDVDAPVRRYKAPPGDARGKGGISGCPDVSEGRTALRDRIAEAVTAPEPCSDECPRLFGDTTIACTLPKGHAVHKSAKDGTAWERLCDEVVQRAEQAQDAIDRAQGRLFTLEVWARRELSNDHQSMNHVLSVITDLRNVLDIPGGGEHTGDRDG